jgi:hypothetical protein
MAIKVQSVGMKNPQAIQVLTKPILPELNYNANFILGTARLTCLTNAGYLDDRKMSAEMTCSRYPARYLQL